MKVKDLINQLSTLHPDLDIYTSCDCEDNECTEGIVKWYNGRQRRFYSWNSDAPCPPQYNAWGKWRDVVTPDAISNPYLEIEITDFQEIFYCLFIKWEGQK
jgi:hypothetical protein